MNDHDAYMADFMRVFGGLDRWGPGSEADTVRAFESLPRAPESILEIGCGKGIATCVLAARSQARITAVDTDASAIGQLTARLEKAGLSDRVDAVCASMVDLPLNHAEFDLIWAEGSAYVMGVQRALADWKSLLSQDGVLVFSDLVWKSAAPSDEPRAFWQGEYADMQSVATRLTQIEHAGYRVIDHFAQSDEAWKNYFVPLAERVAALQPELPESAALRDLQSEIRICTDYTAEFGYHFFIVASG